MPAEIRRQKPSFVMLLSAEQEISRLRIRTRKALINKENPAALIAAGFVICWCARRDLNPHARSEH